MRRRVNLPVSPLSWQGEPAAPHLAFSVAHFSPGPTLTTLGLAGMVGRLLHGASTKSPFVGLVGALQYVGVGGASTTDFALGASVGYRSVLPGGGLAVRIRGGYERWLRYGGGNRITIGVPLGAIIHSSK